MQPTKSHRFLLVASGLIAAGIGASILLAPTWFHSSHGIELGTDASVLSEVRAPGGALLVLGALMLLGVFRASFTLASTSLAAAVYLSYGLSRLVSIGLDGVPDPGLVGAAVLELAIGAACGVALLRASRGARLERRLSGRPSATRTSLPPRPSRSSAASLYSLTSSAPPRTVARLPR